MNMACTGLYAGSFDPYTNGHHAIVRKAAGLFDVLYVMIAVNTQKRRAFDAETMCVAIQETLRQDALSNVCVVVYSGMVADFCAQNGIRYYVRGLRNNMDYNYEENIAQINHLINPDLETVYMRSDDSAISSSMIRELLTFDKPVDAYVPAPVRRLIADKK